MDKRNKTRAEFYLDHVHPLSNVQEAFLTSDIVQEQHAVCTSEIRLGNTPKPAKMREETKDSILL